MTAGLIVVLFLPEKFLLLFSIIYLTFNSWSFRRDLPRHKHFAFVFSVRADCFADMKQILQIA